MGIKMTKTKQKATKKEKNSALSAEQKVQLYKKMVFYRRFEEKTNMAYMKQKFSGFCHLHIGQEALCAGVGHCIEASDYMISGYRSHTQAIDKGISAKSVMAELFGKVTGCSRGKGGSMHMFSKEHNFLGGHGIVGGQVPLAVGAGFAIKYRKERQVVICYLGDAAINQGQALEAFNMAATWNLPVLFIIENNKYGMGTAITRTTNNKNLYERALAFNMAHSAVDAMNIETVIDHVSPIIATMRKDQKPYLLEALTYRYKGHSVSDPGTYRTKEELASYQEQDPITQLAKTLIDESIAKEEDLKEWDKEIKTELKEVEAFADQSDSPAIEEAWKHVFA